MSDNNLFDTSLHTPYQIILAPTLSDSEQHTSASLLGLLPASCVKNIALNGDNIKDKSAIHISSVVDGRGLACPMPLLKTKVALREVATGNSLYVVATDPNSQADIVAFCQQTQQANNTDALQLILNQTTQPLPNTKAQTPDTIFHFIITKTDSN